jgi:AmmeMemoRadiSam system protein B
MMLPHAGYEFSGSVAAAVLSRVKPKSSYIIVGPKHTISGYQFSVCASDTWKTPLGDLRIDDKLAEAVLKNCDLLRKDEFAHTEEHSIEVQLPIMQRLCGSFTFVPIVIAPSSVDTYRRIGLSIARAVKESKKESDISIIASSDMTHYESSKSAKEKDSKALEAILELNEEALVERVNELDISMCGFAPVAIMLAAAKELGAKKARLVKYQTSGDATGDYSSVVGYAGVIIN